MEVTLLCLASACGGGVLGFGLCHWLAIQRMKKAVDRIPSYMVAYRQSLKTLCNWLDNVPNKAEVAIRREADNLAKELKAKL